MLFRNGDSEYAINGVPCRLLDVQELLSDAGVGRQQHVIVSQGQIDAVLNARPEDRRGIIEEAAGVLKYRKRKEKAERRLDATEANLLRLQDLLREVRRSVASARTPGRGRPPARVAGRRAHDAPRLRRRPRDRWIADANSRRSPATGSRRSGSRPSSSRVSPSSTPRSCRSRPSSTPAARATSAIASMRVEQLRERARGIAGILAERRRSLERDRGQLLDAGVVANLEADAARFRAELDDVEVALVQGRARRRASTGRRGNVPGRARPRHRGVGCRRRGHACRQRRRRSAR